MSQAVQFFNYRKAGDKEKGFEKYKQLLDIRKQNSEKAQTEARNTSIGIEPVYPIPKTYDEILKDNSEIETRLRNFIYSFFPDKRNAVRPPNMTANQFLLISEPTSVLLSQLLPNEKQFIVQHMADIAEDLKKVSVLTPQYFLDYVRKYIGVLRQEGAISSKFHQSTINNFSNNASVPAPSAQASSAQAPSSSQAPNFITPTKNSSTSSSSSASSSHPSLSSSNSSASQTPTSYSNSVPSASTNLKAIRKAIFNNADWRRDNGVDVSITSQSGLTAQQRQDLDTASQAVFLLRSSSKNSPSSSQGSGILRKVHPKYSHIVGRGIELANHEVPKRYYEFGKLAISIVNLRNHILRVKYLASTNYYPTLNGLSVSNDFVEVLEDLLESGKLNDRMYHKLSLPDKKLLQTLIEKAGLYNQFKLKPVHLPEEEEERKRFEIVKGEYCAGNDSDQIKAELKRFLVKFILENRISKAEGNSLLFLLSHSA